jgi:hypothetical protein
VLAPLTMTRLRIASLRRREQSRGRPEQESKVAHVDALPLSQVDKPELRRSKRVAMRPQLTLVPPSPPQPKPVKKRVQVVAPLASPRPKSVNAPAPREDKPKETPAPRRRSPRFAAHAG